MFTAGGCLKVLGGCADNASGEGALDLDLATIEVFEEAFGVFLFLVGRFFEDEGDLNEAIVSSLAGEVRVAITCLGFAGEGHQQVLFGF